MKGAIKKFHTALPRSQAPPGNPLTCKLRLHFEVWLNQSAEVMVIANADEAEPLGSACPGRAWVRGCFALPVLIRLGILVSNRRRSFFSYQRKFLESRQIEGLN